MDKLYWAPNSAALAPQAILEEAGAPYEILPVDLKAGAQRSPDYLALNPGGYVPALVTADGQVLTESAAIMLTLAERHPETGLLPAAGDPARGTLLRWLFYLTNTVQEAYKRFYYAARYSTDPADAPRIRQKATADLLERWAVVERHLASGGPFVLGRRASVADIYLLMLATWYEPLLQMLDACPSVRRCCEALAQRPAIAKVLAAHGQDWAVDGVPDRDAARPGVVLDYWFGAGMAERWFVKDPAFDREVRRRLGALYERAILGQLKAWRDHAEGCLALVLLLDQVPRNLFRDDPRAYASDAEALAIAEEALSKGFDRQLPQVRRVFLYLPLEHSEDLAVQERCVELMGALDEQPDWRDYAVKHRDIVARFGRFPHRNAALGRTTTAEEEEFLKQPGSSF